MSLLYRVKGVRKLYLILQNIVFNGVYRRRLGNKITIFGFPIIRIAKGASIRIGKNGVFCSDSYFNEPGLNHPVNIRLMSAGAKLTIGNQFGISGGSICVQKEVQIGDEVLMGANAFISDTDFHPVAPENRRSSRENIGSAKVVIGNNVFIGMNAIILKGVSVGDNSIIAAGSVVTRHIPANQIWGGNPAKFLKEI